ncbi:unnamed protein product [Prunus armeniaca]
MVILKLYYSASNVASLLILLMCQTRHLLPLLLLIGVRHLVVVALFPPFVAVVAALLANVLGSSQAAYASSYHDGSSSGYVWVQCQICGRLGHSTIICYNRLNLAYEGHVPPQLLNTMAAHNTSSSAA